MKRNRLIAILLAVLLLCSFASCLVLEPKKGNDNGTTTKADTPTEAPTEEPTGEPDDTDETEDPTTEATKEKETVTPKPTPTPTPTPTPSGGLVGSEASGAGVEIQWGDRTVA